MPVSCFGLCPLASGRLVGRLITVVVSGWLLTVSPVPSGVSWCVPLPCEPQSADNGT